MSWVQSAIAGLCGVALATRVPSARGARRWIFVLASLGLVSEGLIGVVLPYPPTWLAVLAVLAALLAVILMVYDVPGENRHS